MKVLVTGANSLLGANVVEVLLKRGYSARGMVRTKGKIPFSYTYLEEFTGDITDNLSVQKAAKGCDAIIHVAANTSQDCRSYKAYASVNITGSIHVFNAAKTLGIKRMILVSSANAFAYGSIELPGTEDQKISYPFSRASYARSKYEAQQKLLQLAAQGGPELIVVNPTFMIGKYDSKPSSGAIIIRGYKKKIILAPPGGKNFIHVKDAAEAICNALKLGKPGSCYLLANENMSYKKFYQKMNQVTGQSGKIIIIPKGLLLLAGGFGSILTQLGIATPMHYINMRILCVKNYYSNKKAVDELKLNQTPLTVAISDAVEWFIGKGMLK